jgi:hypothetical protein
MADISGNPIRASSIESLFMVLLSNKSSVVSLPVYYACKDTKFFFTRDF